MIDLEKDGLTQTIMSLFVGVTPVTISRTITSMNISPIHSPNQRNLRYSIPNSKKVMGALMGRKNIMKKIHAFYNFKGGTGKTSICYQAGCHLSLLGYKVLLVDADPQAHLTSSVGINDFGELETLYDCIVQGKNVHDLIKNVYEGLDIVPANLSLTRLEPELNNMARREERLSIEMIPLKTKYDFIFIDTNPTISILNRNVIEFSDYLEIVAETHPFSLTGLRFLVEDLDKFYTQMQLPPRPLNIIPNKYEDRSSNSAEAMAALRKYYSKSLKLDFAIRKSEEIITSSKISKPLALFVKKNSIALEDIIELGNYILTISSSAEEIEEINEKN